MEQTELVKRVMAMLTERKEIIDALKAIKDPKDLQEFLDSFSNSANLNPTQTKRFLELLKEENVFKLHFSKAGMEEIWRDWSRSQGVKEGHFLFEN